ncbi:DUF1697 domain-containing protein [Bosea sp. CCNWLW174]|uniref:DUF1697 domain-containing protein n=1 Tax=unclassified Bosea (in: a-proteobacteria) TaxID=2653178 RepID=UPI00301482CF
MTAFIALLRAVNVGGTGKLPMSNLRDLCQKAGLGLVRTYIASGNVVFASDATEAEVKALLEEQLRAYAGKPIGVLVRTAKELAAVSAGNPFPTASPNRTVVIFLDQPPHPGTLAGITGQDGEEVSVGVREIYVHYGDKMGRSKLSIPHAAAGTARNMNTVAALVTMATTPPD